MKNIKYISLAAVISCLVFELLCYFLQKNTLSGLSLLNNVSLFAVSGTIFLLPDFLEEKLGNKKWFYSSEFITITILLLLALLGIVVGKYACYLSVLLLIIVAYVLFKSIQQINFTLLSILALALGISVVFFIILIQYSVKLHSLLVIEKIVSGTAFIDVLFHAAVSNAVDTYGYPSTELDGVPFLRYHWGSHVLFAGLKNVCGVSAVKFYNIEYSILFVPLFIKSILYLTRRLDSFFENELLYLFLSLTFIIVFYSVDVFGYLGQPMISESYCISIAFSCMLFSMFFAYPKDEAISYILVAFSAFMILVIFFFKISTGVVVLGGIGYFYIRKQSSWKDLFVAGIIGLLIITVVYLCIFPVDRAGITDSLIQRYSALWRNSQGVIDFCLGILILIFVVISQNELKSISDFKNIITEKKYILYESLAVVSIIGFACGVMVSFNSSDVLFFAGTQLYFCLPILIVFSYKVFVKLKAINSIKIATLLILSMSSIFAKPEIGKGMVDWVKLKKTSKEVKDTVYKQLLEKLIAIEKEDNKKEKCIYIPPTERWYFDAQEKEVDPFRDSVESALVVPAVSGLSLIGGVPQNVLDSTYLFYGIYFSKKHRDKQAQNLQKAMHYARKDGFRILIYMKEEEGILIEERYTL